MTASPRDGRNRFRGLRAIRFPWQRRANAAPANASPLVANHEQVNDARFAAPVGDRRAALVLTLPAGDGNEAAQYVLQDYQLPAIFPKNPLSVEIAFVARALWLNRCEMPASRSVALIDGASDAKSPGDHVALALNHEVLPLFETNREIAQRFKFTRYLVQQGIFNEGFVSEEMPEQYRTFSELYDDSADDRPDLD